MNPNRTQLVFCITAAAFVWLAACDSEREQAEVADDTTGRPVGDTARPDTDAPDAAPDDDIIADEDGIDATTDSDGGDRPFCTPDAFVRCASDTEEVRCSSDGLRILTQPCTEDAPFCVDEVGCFASLCQPGVTTGCYDATTPGICNEAGTGFDPLEPCSVGVCVEPGECEDACVENAKNPSNLGCEYWAVDLPQDRGDTVGGDDAGGAEAQTWAVVLSNPGNEPAAVSIFAAANPATAIESVTVPARSLQIVEMPRDDIFATSITDNSFRIVANRPIAAHQFNPLNNVAVQSNDASLLFPVNALGLSYRILSYRTRVSWYAAATVVAVEPGTTTVTVVSPDEIYSPEDDERGEEGVMEGWDDRLPRTFTLTQGQVLNLATRFSTDLTGMSVNADKPVAVFSSAAGIYIPNASGTADHIEHQMLPLDAWRDRYVGVPFAPRGTVPDYFRIVAAEDNTVVTASLPISGRDWTSGRTELNAGEWTEFAATQPFEINATGPVQVAHYMAGSQAEGVPQTCEGASGAVGLGDPALTILVPVEQWRDNYTVLIPNNYTDDYVSIFGALGAEVSVELQDGTLNVVSLSTPIPSTTFGFARYAVPRAAGGRTTASNVLRLSSSEPFGTEVFGWSCAVSYAYPGGLNLESADAEER